MATGWIAYSCLLLAAATPTPDDVVHLAHRGFQIPIKIKPEHARDIKEVILYVSRDQGRNWSMYTRSTPDQKAFNFVTHEDGTLYFGIAVTDASGKLDPPDIYKAPVGLKVCVDTVKPDVRLTAERVGDEVQVSWEVKEERPDWTSLKLEYRAGAGQWVPVPVVPGERGTARLRAPGGGEVSLQLTLRDLAGNEGKAEKVVAVGGLGHRDAAVVSAGGVGPLATKVPMERVEEPVRRNDGAPPPLVGGGALPPPPTLAAQPTQPAATTAPASTGPLPELRIVNKRQIKVGFDVSKVGVSGVGSVDVYVTEDEGQSWSKSPDGASMMLPPPGESGKAPRGNVTVGLAKDGVRYGFYLVLKSRAGLGKAAPAAGTPPQVRVEVDATLPIAALFAPRNDANRRDCVILSWHAADRNLASNPVSLEWSTSASGPWSFVGDAQLPNSLAGAGGVREDQPTGQYTWQVPANVPAKVYLKLTVRDTAGNTAVAQTDQPVLIDLTEPEVGNVGVEPGR